MVVKKGKSLKRSKGKKIARERLSLLFDNGDFTEIDPYVKHFSNDFGLDKSRIDGDSVVVGYGTVNGQQVFAFSQDFTVLGGSLSKVASNKICKVFDLAIKTGCPIVGINDSGGQESKKVLILFLVMEKFLKEILWPQVSFHKSQL